jgi:trk system potassium uptake protein TrkH
MASTQPRREGARTLAQLAVAAVGVDVVFAAGWSGTVAVVCMVVALVVLLPRVMDRILQPGKARVIRLEAGLFLALAVIAAARAYVAWLQLTPADPPLPHAQAARLYAGLFIGIAALLGLVVWRSVAVADLLQRGLRRPSLALATSFFVLIVTASLLLSLPIAVHRLHDLSLLDALFHATSAVCVTGLTVDDVGTTYTLFGQVVILVAMQLGGLGIMTIAAFALSFRQGVSLGEQAHMVKVFGTTTISDLRGLLRGIVTATLILELCGTLLLYAVWRRDPSIDSPLWYALFHAVAAFCNAGISLWPDGLARFRADPVTQLIVMALIVGGGLGFPVWRELASRLRIRVLRWLEPAKPRPPRLSLDAHIAMRMSGILIVIGACALALVESGQAFAGFSAGERVLASLFASVAARTAGFATIDLATLSQAGVLVTLALMFVGGSPGSMAGGVKTTTLAVMIATLVGELRGHEPRLAHRSLAPETIRRATAVVVASIVFVVSVTLLLSLTENARLEVLAFEAVSAFSTTGLSLGLTPQLSEAGKIVVLLTMFVGRVGPLTVALAVGRDRRPTRHKLPPEELTIG